MRLLFVRHGDPDYVHDSLTETGFREAEYLSRRLSRTHISAIYVSPKGRAQATAAPTLEKTGIPALTCDWLKEFDVPVLRPDKNGELSGIPWDWLPQDLDKAPELYNRLGWRENRVFLDAGVGNAYDAVIAQFDALLKAHGYVRSGLFYRAERPNTDTLVFFCHLGLACVLMSHLINCSPIVLWQGTCLPPASVTTVYTEERRPGLASFRIQALGDTSHLYVGGAEPSFAGRFCEIYGNGDRTD